MNMKKAPIFLTLALLMLVGFVNAQTIESVPVENENAPEIVFENESHDFGTLSKGADCSCVFKFKNEGKEPLTITMAKASCGCTVPSWPKEPIAAGGSGEIKVVYDSKRVGPFTKSITVTSNAKTPSKVLHIKGKIEAPAVEAPQGTASPGPVQKSN